LRRGRSIFIFPFARRTLNHYDVRELQALHAHFITIHHLQTAAMIFFIDEIVALLKAGKTESTR